MKQTKRAGWFRISRYMIDENPAEALAVYDGCIVVHAECMYDTDNIHCIAIHGDFDPIPRHEAAPEYRAILEGGKRRWEKVS